MKKKIGLKELNKYQIKSIRANWWDYASNGNYFITICTKNMNQFFGKIRNEKVELNEIGNITKRNWENISTYFPFVSLGPYIIMPNHLHGIIKIDKSLQPVITDEAKFGPQSENLASIMRGFKSSVTIEARKIDPIFCWQARFYDRIIRDEKELQNIIEYIYDNPLQGKLPRRDAIPRV
jgi:REP element-mobilizing transposase RayT